MSTPSKFKSVLVRKFNRRSTTAEDINHLFESRLSPDIILSPETITINNLRTFAIVRFLDNESAMNALKFNGQELYGYKLKIEPRIIVDGDEDDDNEFRTNLDPIFVSSAACQLIDDTEILNKLLIVNSLDEQVEILRRELLMTNDDLRRRETLTKKLEVMISVGAKIGIQKIHMLGSSVSCLGFKDSDLDLFIELPDRENVRQKMPYESAIYLLGRIREVLQEKLAMAIEPVIPSFRCPIIRLDFKNLPRLREAGIKCDLSLSNALGSHNSKLIQFLCQLEPRFQLLAMVIRYWARTNDLIGPYDISSYAITMLVIFFCQNTLPPLLPPIVQLIILAPTLASSEMEEDAQIEGWNCRFCNDINQVPKSENASSVVELVEQFFQFYSKYSFEHFIVHPRSGKSMYKDTFVDEYDFNGLFSISEFVCIQDPFDLEHNLTASMKKSLFTRFSRLIKSYTRCELDSIFHDNTKKSNLELWGLAKLLFRGTTTESELLSW